MLSSKQEEEIFQQTKDAFSDFPYFDSLVAVKLKQAIHDIHDSRNSEINFATTMEGAAKYFDRKAFKVSGANIVQSDLELVWKHIKVIFRYSYVAIVAYTTPTDDKALKEEFVNNYPSFLSQEDMDSNEFNRLFVFWKMIKIAITIIQPENNKQTLIDVCGRFEDSQDFYITGKGQRQEVTNRVLIYGQEGNVEPEVRPWRSNAEAAGYAAAKATASKKRKKTRSQDALKTANNVQLDPKLVKWLALSVSPKMQQMETEGSFLYSALSNYLFDIIVSNGTPSVSSTTSLTAELVDLVGSIAFQIDLFLENGYFDEESFLNNCSFHADCFKAYDTDCTVSDVFR